MVQLHNGTLLDFSLHDLTESCSRTPPSNEKTMIFLLFYAFFGSSLGRFWQDVPVLAMVSMLAYFCFLEQLLVINLTCVLAEFI